VTSGADPSCSDRYFAVVFSRGNDIVYRDYASGTEHVVISDGSEPVFGPGSTQIAFVRAGQIWVCDLNGNGAHAVTPGPGDRQPNWGRIPGEN